MTAEREDRALFCQVDAGLDSNPKIRAAGRDGREVFLFALRARANLRLYGFVPVRYFEPSYLSHILMVTSDEARVGYSKALTAELLREYDGNTFIVGWQSEWDRKVKRGKAIWDAYMQHVPTRNCTEERRVEETRGEESRVEVPRDARPATNADSGSGSTARKGARTQTTIPDDWSPRSQEREKAVELGVDCDREADKFRDHHAAKGSRFTDWDAAFRTWLRNAQEFSMRNGRLPSRPAPQTTSQGRLNAQLERVRRLEAEEAEAARRAGGGA